MKRYLFPISVAILMASTSACTPIQLDVFQTKTGITLSDDDRTVLLGLPDVPVQVGADVIYPDGSVVTASYVHRNPNVQRWYWVALDKGWTDAQWRWVACTMSRESHGNPESWNHHDSGRGSAGLFQINSVHTNKLIQAGIIERFEDLLDGPTALAAAKFIFDGSGKGPWRSRSHPC